MKNLSRLCAGLALGLAAIAAAAHGYTAGAIKIGHPYSRPTVPGQPTGAGYMSFDNQGSGADRLVGASAAIATRVEMHTMNMEGDVMRMRQVDTIELPAGTKVELKPAGMHLMLIGLKAPLKAGERVPLTLRFEKAGEVTVELAVDAPKADAPSAAEHKH